MRMSDAGPVKQPPINLCTHKAVPCSQPTDYGPLLPDDESGYWRSVQSLAGHGR